MNFLKFIKHIFLFLLTFLIGTQTTYAKTEFALPHNQVSFLIEQTQSFSSLEKVIQPNIGFLKEKSKFGKSTDPSTQINCNFSKRSVEDLANSADELIIDGITYKRKYFGKNNTEIYVRISDDAESIQYYLTDNLSDDISSFMIVDGSFIPEIEISLNLRGQGIGSGIFNDAFKDLGGSKVIDGIESSWTANTSLSDNFNSFRSNLLNEMDPIEAALNTATGSWSKNLGYENVLISLKQANEVKQGTRYTISLMFTR